MTAALRVLTCFVIVAAGTALAAAQTRKQDTAGPVMTGAQLLADDGFALLQGRRVGLIANHTSTVRGKHLADLIHAAPGVTLAALFAPEHGLRGTGAAGEKVPDDRDEKTGVPVYSLYGDTLQPTRAMLKGVDVLVFDIQDIGARFYTFISTMGLAMQAAAKAGIAFIVLDRPNPLGGTYVAGFRARKRHISFVGQYAIPLVHGLTVGELARMIQGEKLLPGLEKLKLDVVAMEGWRRAMLWPDTERPWVATSPAIPDFETALIYPGAGFFEATAASEGRGTETPFKLIGAPWADSAALAAELNGRGLPGVSFEAATFTPQRRPGMSDGPKLKGRQIEGVRLTVTDPRAYLTVETGVHLLHAFRAQARAKRAAFINRPDWLARLAGTTRLNGMLRKGESPRNIIAAWDSDVKAFLRQRASYLLYP
jgi:uncharacterized protein YbbC (DUF1343 family)